MDHKRDINFIPEEQKETKSYLATTIIFYLIAISIIIGVGGVFLPKTYLQSKIDEKNRLAEEESFLKNKAIEYDQLNTKNLYLTGKKKAYDALDKDRVKVNAILAELENALPKSVIISNISVTQSGLSVQASASSNTDIAQLYVNLLNSKYFRNVVINNISTERDTNRLSFPINISIEIAKDTEQEEGGNQ